MAKTKTKTAEPELFAPGEGPKVDVRGGYSAPRGGTKPPLPKTGTGVARAAKSVPAQMKAAQSLSILQIAKEASADPRVDADKMRAIIGMAREEQNRLDEQAFEKARLAVQSEIPPITKDTLNSHTKSKWARLEKISAIVDPIIRKHGFTMSYGQADCPLPDHYRITAELVHTPTGYKKSYFIDVGMDAEGAKGGGTKSKAQGSGSSISYGRRFLKVMIFDINVVGEDFDGNRSQTANVDTISADEADVIREKIRLSGLKVETFCEVFEIGSVDKLPASKYDLAVTKIENYAREVAAAKAKKEQR